MNIKHIKDQIIFYKNKYGIWETIRKCIKKVLQKIKSLFIRKKEDKEVLTMDDYHKWIYYNEPKEAELEEQRKVKFEIEPKISIIVPMYETPTKFFKELVDCIIDQTYNNWELCLADGSKEKNSEIQKIVKKDERIKYKFLNANERNFK